MTGRPIFALPLSASITPRATDGGIAAFFAEMEALAPTNGSFQVGLHSIFPRSESNCASHIASSNILYLF